MKNNIADVAASVRGKLMNISKQTRRDYNSLLRLYSQERLLYRLSQAARERFILKGGLLLFSVAGLLARPTQDIDLMGRGQINDESLAETFRQIAAVQCDDGITFDPDSVTVIQIMEKGELDGRRVLLTGRLGLTARLPMQIDIGYGDIVVPQPTTIHFPVMIPEYPVPELSCYSVESAVAEKFHAMVTKDILNSRMKDFYDVWFYSTQRVFDGPVLQDALAQTFERRRTDPDPEPWVFSQDSVVNPEKATYWDKYLKRIGTSIGLTYPEIVAHIRRFIGPAWSAICEEREFNLFWDPDMLQWRETRPVRTVIVAGE